jgi:hypothetical protein
MYFFLLPLYSFIKFLIPIYFKTRYPAQELTNLRGPIPLSTCGGPHLFFLIPLLLNKTIKIDPKHKDKTNAPQGFQKDHCEGSLYTSQIIFGMRLV